MSAFMLVYDTNPDRSTCSSSSGEQRSMKTSPSAKKSRNESLSITAAADQGTGDAKLDTSVENGVGSTSQQTVVASSGRATTSPRNPAAHHAGKSTSTTSACVDLQERFGKRYKVTYEESYQAARGTGASRGDPWLMILPCRHGHIYPHGGSTLAASTNHRGPTARKLAALDCTTVYQDGDDGVTVHFDVADFVQVAKVMKPRRRRQMTEEQKQVATERLAKYAFSSAVGARPEAQISTQGVAVVL
jgi:hypothetical protein